MHLLRLLAVLLLATTTFGLPRSLPTDLKIASLSSLPGYPNSFTTVVPGKFNPLSDAWELAAATKLAVEEVNSDPSILPSHKLNLVFDDAETDPAKAIGVGLSLFNPTSPNRVIAALGPSSTNVLDKLGFLADYFKLPLVTDWVTSAEAKKLNSITQILAPDSAEIDSIESLLRNYNWDQVCIISSGFAAQLEWREAFINRVQAPRKGLKPIKLGPSPVLPKFSNAQQLVSGDRPPLGGTYADTVRRELEHINAEGFRIVVLNIQFNEIDEFFKAAKGIVDNTWLFIGTKRWMKPIQFFKPPTRPALKGIIGIGASVDNTSVIVQNFTTRWEAQYALNPNNTFNIPKPFMSQPRYDAVNLLARGLHALVGREDVCNGSTALPSTIIYDAYTCQDLYDPTKRGELLQTLIRAQSFEGVTGDVKYANGLRVPNQIVQNYQDDLTDVGTANNDTVILNSNVEFPDGSNVPRSQKITSMEVVTASSGTVNGILIFASVLCVCVLGLLVFQLVCRKNASIRMSSPLMNSICLFGNVILVGYIFVLTADQMNSSVSSSSCLSQYALLSYGFTLAFGALALKAFRVHRLFNVSMQKFTVTRIYDYHLVMALAVLLVLDSVIVVAWHYTDNITVEIQKSEIIDNGSSFTLRVFEVCTSDHFSSYITALLVYKGFVLLFGAAMAYETRNVDIPALNESKILGYTIYNVVTATALLVPVIALTSDPTTIYYLSCLVVALLVSLMVLWLYVPKVIRVIRGESDKDTKRQKAHPRASISQRPSSTDDDLTSMALEQRMALLAKENRKLKSQIVELSTVRPRNSVSLVSENNLLAIPGGSRPRSKSEDQINTISIDISSAQNSSATDERR